MCDGWEDRGRAEDVVDLLGASVVSCGNGGVVMVRIVYVEQVVSLGEGKPWVDAFRVIEASVGVDYQDIFFVVCAKHLQTYHV